MKISDIITNKSVVILDKIENKRSLLQELSKHAANLSGIESRTIFDSLLERENLGSTGFGRGTALPHTRLAETEKVFGMFAKLTSPIDFDSVDGKPVDLLFLLLSPENSGADHLTALALTSRILKDEEICKTLRQATKPDEIYSILTK